MSRTARVDEVDRRIVAALQRDGRRPFTSIGRELGISEAAVRQRVARLQAAGIMQVVAVADPMALGYQAMAMVAIEVDGRARKQVAEAVGRLPEVSYLVLTAGSFDMLAEVVCEDNDHLLRLLSEDLAAVEGVRRTETFMYLRLLKEAYTWSVAPDEVAAAPAADEIHRPTAPAGGVHSAEEGARWAAGRAEPRPPRTAPTTARGPCLIV
jgi:Lrp/AsnC family transcriptional regulator for asnA, asnC and gidA